MMHIPEQQFQGYQQQYAAAAARRARLRGPDTRINMIKRQPIQILAIAPPEPPLWKGERIRFDWHEIEYRARLSPEGYLVMIKIKTSIEFKKGRRYSQSAEMADVKNMVAYHLYTAFNLSTTRIGKMMNTDHSTTSRRISQHCRKSGLVYPGIARADLSEKISKAREMFEKGISVNKIGVMLKMSPNTIRTAGRAEGWYINQADVDYEKFASTVNRKIFEAMTLAGYSIRTITRKLKAPETCVMRLCDEMGLVYNGRGG